MQAGPPLTEAKSRRSYCRSLLPGYVRHVIVSITTRAVICDFAVGCLSSRAIIAIVTAIGLVLRLIDTVSYIVSLLA